MTGALRTIGFATAAGLCAGALLLPIERAVGKGEGEAERNRMLVSERMQAWADGTGSPYDLLADDARWTIPGASTASRTYRGRQAFLGEVVGPFNARMRERLIPRVHRLYAEGDTVIAHFEARGVARDGKPYADTYAWFLRMEDGRIVEADAFFDAAAFDDLWRRVPPAVPRVRRTIAPPPSP